MRLLGLALFVIGALLLAGIYLPVAVEELKYNLPKPEAPSVIPNNEKDLETLKRSNPTWEQTVLAPVNFDFSLLIPTLGINAAVFPNVDSGNPNEYLPILRQGVAHAAGSSLPDQPGPVFIFAHSTDTFYNIGQYNAVFFLLNKLQGGEDIYIFYKDWKYHYQVTEKKILEPDEITDFVYTVTDDTLILQTCYPPGTTLKRLLVLAKPV